MSSKDDSANCDSEVSLKNDSETSIKDDSKELVSDNAKNVETDKDVKTLADDGSSVKTCDSAESQKDSKTESQTNQSDLKSAETADKSEPDKSESSNDNQASQDKSQQRPNSGKKSKKNKKGKGNKEKDSEDVNAQSDTAKTPGSARKNSNTPRKRYTSLQDIVMSPSTTNSDAVKRLFDDSYEGRLDENQVVTEMDRKVMAAVPDKYLLRTGKVSNCDCNFMLI